jgi:DNA cross-link repair 1A protein
VVAVSVGDTVEVKTGDGATARVTLLDANHCPGSVLLHFLNTTTKHTVLHTGDFRAAACVREDAGLHRLIAAHGPIGELLLDTTYCSPQWKFPDQSDVCDAMVAVVRAELHREPRWGGAS